MFVFAIPRLHSSEVMACHTRRCTWWGLYYCREEVNMFPVKSNRMCTLLWSIDSGPPYTIAICIESTFCCHVLVWLWCLLLCAVDRVQSLVWCHYFVCQLTLYIYVLPKPSAVRPLARPSSGSKRQKTVLQLFALFRTGRLLLLVRRIVHVDQTNALRFCTISVEV